ncbi:MAG: nicotinamide mononucleotide transporter family protein [Pseudomonadota bacterium]
MTIAGYPVPMWLFDWLGSAFVVVSLLYLWKKQLSYWLWSNLSTLPYFILFILTKQWLLAGLQVSYLVFGVHGQCLWWLEKRRDQRRLPFNEFFWYKLGWMLSILIFLYATSITDLAVTENRLQFIITTFSLLANWATTRKWLWSWPVWICVNLLQIGYFWQLQLHGLLVLQFVLIAMSVKGWIEWRKPAVHSGVAVEA